MVATAIYSVTMVLWKETAFPLCRAMEKQTIIFIIIIIRPTQRPTPPLAGRRVGIDQSAEILCTVGTSAEVNVGTTGIKLRDP